jgi:3',5'-cyclic-nucleotide phosphodiesterase
MKLTVLGCSGGIGGRSTHTTSFLVDQDTLIDCGTGVGALDYDALLRIDQIFVSHSHLDHIAFLPLLVDTVAEERQRAITVYALPETLRILRSHIFNWLIWPDFSAIPDRHNPFLRFQPVNMGESVRLAGGRSITLLPAHHTVPACAFCLDSGSGKLVYSGDTTHAPDLVEAINGLRDLRHLIIETAFSDAQHALALAARHLCPSLLAAFLDDLRVCPAVWVSHLKPGIEDKIMGEIQAYGGRLVPGILRGGQVIEF